MIECHTAGEGRISEGSHNSRGYLARRDCGRERGVFAGCPDISRGPSSRQRHAGQALRHHVHGRRHGRARRWRLKRARIATRKGLLWSSRTRHQATGTGSNWIDFCNPSCDTGADHAYPVRVRLWDPRFEFGWIVFTRMTITYTGRVPKLQKRRSTLRLTHGRVGGVDGGFGWIT